MDFNAFEWIQNSLATELEKQGFGQPEPLEDPAGQAVMFSADEVAYSLLYDKTHQRFELRSTTLRRDGKPTEWRSLSTWLFDSETGERSDAESIINDFLEVIRGPQRVAMVQQKRKRGKDDERAVDPLFFLNRLVTVFPELRDSLNEEKIVYGQVRAVTYVKERVVPLVEELAREYPESDPCKRLCSLLDDMYKDGDMDLRSVVTYGLLDGLSDDAFEKLAPQLGEELRRAMKYSRRLRGRKIKPEKKKKQKKVETRLEN